MIRCYDEGVNGPSQLYEDPDGAWCRRDDVDAALVELRGAFREAMEHLQFCGWGFAERAEEIRPRLEALLARLPLEEE